MPSYADMNLCPPLWLIDYIPVSKYLYILLVHSHTIFYNLKEKITRTPDKCYLVLKCHRHQTNEAGDAQDRSVPLYGIFQSVFLYSQEVAKNRQKEQRNCYKYSMYYSSLIFSTIILFTKSSSTVHKALLKHSLDLKQSRREPLSTLF